MAKKVKFSRGGEVLWAVIFFMSIGVSIHKTFYHGFSESLMFYGFIFLSATMYLIKKKMRIKQEAENDD